MKIGFAQHNPRFAFWMLLGHAAGARAAELDADLVVEPATTAAEQAAAIDALVDQGIAALIVGAIDSQALAPAVERAIAAGIPVIAADTEISGCAVSSTIGSDNVRGAELATSFLIERIGARGAIAHLQGPPTAQSAIQRARGFHNIVAQHPSVTLAYEATGDWSQAAGFRLAGEALAAAPDLRALFTANDPMALGALDAIAAAGRSGQVLVAGFDALPETLKAIYQGAMAATVRQQPTEIGRGAVELAVRAARGQPVDPRVQVEVRLLTADSLVEAALDTLELFPSILRDMVDSGAALARERALLRSVIDAIPDTHLFVKDRASRFVITNAAHLQTLGLQRVAQVIGKTDQELTPGPLADQYYADEQALMESGVPLHDLIEPVIDSAGAQHWYLTSKVPLRDASGNVTGHVGVSRNITALRQAEQERGRLQAEMIRMQEAALRELSTPLIPISDNVLVMPLIGTLNDQRTQQILETLLEGITASGAEIAILDITGVPVVDTHTANALIRAAQAVKLVGAQVVLSGIRPEVAQTMVGLGVDFRDIVTSSTLQSGVAYALKRRVGS
jgi:PAS domain S-box-containing protein